MSVEVSNQKIIKNKIDHNSLAVQTLAFRPVGALFDEVENLIARSGKGLKSFSGKKT